MIDLNEDKMEELQIYISNALQVMASQAIDNGSYDAYTVFATAEEIAKMYKKNIKKEWMKLAKNRKKYEEDNAEILKVLDVDEPNVAESESTFIVTE